MKKFLSIYLLFVKQTIRQELVHRVSFITGVIGQWLSYAVTFITIYIMITQFGSLGGYTGEEVMFLYAFNLLSYALAACVFFTPCTNLPTKIRTGEFDAALTKPMSPFVNEICNGFNFGYIGHTILSIVIMVIAVSGTSISFHFGTAVLFLVLLISSALIQAAILILLSSLSFVLLNDNPLFSSIMFQIKRFIDYPITIYGGVYQVLLTVIFPLAFINFYPTTLLLGTPSSPMFPAFTAYLTPLVGGFLFWLSITVWNKALSKYQSSGS